jgi:Uma2 family endonuclease
MANGVLLGWLIDPEKEVVYIYRQGQDEVEEVRNFQTSVLSGEGVLPGFVFPLVELNL